MPEIKVKHSMFAPAHTSYILETSYTGRKMWNLENYNATFIYLGTVKETGLGLPVNKSLRVASHLTEALKCWKCSDSITQLRAMFHVDPLGRESHTWRTPLSALIYTTDGQQKQYPTETVSRKGDCLRGLLPPEDL